MRVAIVYDRVNKWGGAERVLLVLHQLFPDAVLFSSVYHPQKAPWARVFPKIIKSYLQWFPKAPSLHEAYAPFMPLAFESFTFNEFDLVISVTSEAAKGIITQPKTIHICYCLTPTRYLWSGFEEYFSNPLLRVIASPIIWYLRKWDLIASDRPDGYIAISKEVQQRIKKYYKKESVIVYPPVSLGTSDEGLGPKQRRLKKKTKPYTLNPNPYFLVVSRLVPYKRIDIAIEACNELKIPLKIVGNGSQRTYLQSIAGETIEFLGNLTDRELVRYYEQCEALVFPGKEDFGITIVEAQRFGKPVIAYKGGGALETIHEGKTGMLFYPQSKAALKKSLKQFDASLYRPAQCKKQAEKFSLKTFKKSFLKAIQIHGLKKRISYSIIYT